MSPDQRPRTDGAVTEQNVVLAIELDGRQVVRIAEFANPAIAMVRSASTGLVAPH
ncbi:MAG: hypothetical protein Q8R33_14030 [Burkholderiales bacterium]|nr:hypothetical protein [Burkholderiales bacterium]